jgi:hypothetical protein
MLNLYKIYTKVYITVLNFNVSNRYPRSPTKKNNKETLENVSAKKMFRSSTLKLTKDQTPKFKATTYKNNRNVN